MFGQRNDKTDPTLNVTSAAEIDKAATAATTAAPQKLFTRGQVGAASFVGGPMGGIWLISRNFKALGEAERASRWLWRGMAATAVFMSAFVLTELPAAVTKAVPLAYTFLFASLCTQLQGPALQAAIAAGAKRASHWRVAKIAVTCLVLTFTALMPIALYQTGAWQEMIGTAYSGGTMGLEKNPEKAVEWFKASADKNNDDGQFKMAIVTYHGLGTAKDEPAALDWATKAAEAGHDDAPAFLGFLYLQSQKPENMDLAVKWLLVAADIGEPKAQGAIGTMYMKGIHLKQDDDEALFWLTLAATEEPEAARQREILAARMTPAKVQGVEARVQLWKPKRKY